MATGCPKSSVIIDELKELGACDKSGKQIETSRDNSMDTQCSIPDIAKHYLIFAATTWSPHSESGQRSKHQFICTRYGLKSVHQQFLVPTTRKIILYILYCDFIVNSICGDGATENRSTFNALATIAAQEVLREHYSPDLLESLPTDFKIAFPHPNPEYAMHIKIFVGGEMPHEVKRFRNVIVNSKKELCFHGTAFDLKMFEEIWKK